MTRYAIASIAATTPSRVAQSLPPTYRIVRVLGDMAVLIEGTGPLPFIHGIVEINVATAYLLLRKDET